MTLVKPQSGIIFAAPAPSSTLTDSDATGTYSGLVFNSNGTSPAKLTLDANAEGTGVGITDVANDTEDNSGSVNIALNPHSSLNGHFTGTVDGQPLNCVLSTVSSNTLIACNGADGAVDGGGVYPLFFFLGVKR